MQPIASILSLNTRHSNHINPEVHQKVIYIYIYIKGEGKAHPGTGHEGPRGSRGIALLFL